MAIDKNGNLKPLMLSDLMRVAQEQFTLHGDMIVWVETVVAGYEHNEIHSCPVSNDPTVDCKNKAKENSCWIDKEYKKSFVIEGA